MVAKEAPAESVVAPVGLVVKEVPAAETAVLVDAAVMEVHSSCSCCSTLIAMASSPPKNSKPSSPLSNNSIKTATA